MAQFQRIAPNPQLQTPQVPTPRYGAAYRAFGEVGQVGDVFQRIQDSADIAEASRLSQTIARQIGAAVTKAEMDNAQDPDAYSQVAGDSIQTVFDNGVSQTNPRVRALVTERLSDDMIKLRSGIEQKSYKMKLNKARTDWMVARDEGLNRRILSDDPVEQSAIDAEIMGDLGALSGKGAFTVEEAYKERKRYAQDILVKKAQTMIDGGESDLLLRDLAAGKYDDLEPNIRLSLRRSANAAITSSITIQQREQKIKEEAADRELQGMFDNAAGADAISRRLKEMSAAGVIDRNTRKFYDDKLLRGEVKDSPAQMANLERLKNEFLDVYPTPSRIAQFRERKRAMERSGDLGDTGSSQIGNMLIMAERGLRSEFRADEAAARARQSTEEKKDRMTNAQATQLISKNFPNSNPNKPIMQGHREDMNEFVQRVLLGDEEAGKVAKEIFVAREKKIKEEKERKQKQTTEAAADPKAATILERLKQLPKLVK